MAPRRRPQHPHPVGAGRRHHGVARPARRRGSLGLWPLAAPRPPASPQLPLPPPCPPCVQRDPVWQGLRVLQEVGRSRRLAAPCKVDSEGLALDDLPRGVEVEVEVGASSSQCCVKIRCCVMDPLVHSKRARVFAQYMRCTMFRMMRYRWCGLWRVQMLACSGWWVKGSWGESMQGRVGEWVSGPWVEMQRLLGA